MAMLKLSMEHPDLLDAGVKDWDEARLGAANGRQKDMISWQNQVTALQVNALGLWNHPCLFMSSIQQSEADPCCDSVVTTSSQIQHELTVSSRWMAGAM